MYPGSGLGKFNLIPVIFYNRSMNTVSGKRAHLARESVGQGKSRDFNTATKSL
jgi:hypothetical protein